MSTDDYSALKKDIAEIKMAIIGKADLGAEGLVKKVANHEMRLGRIERIFVMVSGAMVLIGGIYTVARDFIHR